MIKFLFNDVKPHTHTNGASEITKQDEQEGRVIVVLRVISHFITDQLHCTVVLPFGSGRSHTHAYCSSLPDMAWPTTAG